MRMVRMTLKEKVVLGAIETCAALTETDLVPRLEIEEYTGFTPVQVSDILVVLEVKDCVKLGMQGVSLTARGKMCQTYLRWYKKQGATK